VLPSEKPIKLLRHSHVEKTKVSRERDGARRLKQQPQPVQILNKGSLDISQFSVWDSFAVFLRLLVLGRRERMIEKELVLPDSDAEHAPPLADVKKSL
jgi:hypothetical protein